MQSNFTRLCENVWKKNVALSQWNVIYHSSRSVFTGVLAFFSSKFVKSMFDVECFVSVCGCARAAH